MYCLGMYKIVNKRIWQLGIRCKTQPAQFMLQIYAVLGHMQFVSFYHDNPKCICCTIVTSWMNYSEHVRSFSLPRRTGRRLIHTSCGADGEGATKSRSLSSYFRYFICLLCFTMIGQIDDSRTQRRCKKIFIWISKTSPDIHTRSWLCLQRCVCHYMTMHNVIRYCERFTDMVVCAQIICHLYQRLATYIQRQSPAIAGAINKYNSGAARASSPSSHMSIRTY